MAGALALLGATSPFERWAYRAGAGASRKFLAYGISILGLWALTAVAVWIYGWARLLSAPEPTVPTIVAPVLVPVVAAFFVFALLPLVQSLRGLAWRRAYAAAIRREFARIPGFIPNNAAERAVWIVLSLTAGICEEVLLRGFLIRFLHGGPLNLSLAAALTLSCLCFGLGHLYQGLKGVITTAIAGFAFGILFLVSGSLIPCIVLHALIDLQIIYVMRPIPEQAAATGTA
ncbi:MAG TPA: CPBP family intramembrane glutamic endopeptidase [Sphingomicrobium sp.]|nr:CPBP family intramembrane glutamic endopeptidase [Sphingomicrobium sp.]